MVPDKPALVLLHGMTSSDRAWEDLVPVLSRYHDVYTPNALGHRGGEPVRHPTTIADLVDAAERYLDQRHLERPHLAGHSMGGQMAIELARRGRAATVTAFSPAGFWPAGDGTPDQILYGLRRSVRLARRVGPAVKLLVSSASGRRIMMGTVVSRPDRMTAAQARGVISDHAACTLGEGLVITDADRVAPLDPLPCPVTVVWAEKDRVLPLAQCGAIVQERLPGANFIVLPDVGHASTVDDPNLVVRTILAVTGAR